MLFRSPIIGAIHDHITGTYYLTHKNPRFYRLEATNIMSKLPDIKMPEPDFDENGEPYWTGRKLFSSVLPEGFRTTFKANICEDCKNCKKEECENDAYVKIRDSNLICGTIDVRAIGNSKGKIVDRIARDYGSDEAAKFINNVTRLALGALMNHGDRKSVV